MIGIMVSVFANGPKIRGKSQVESNQRFKKWYLMPTCLTLRSRVSGAIPGLEWHPPLNLSVVATEKGEFRSPSTMVGQLIYTSTHMVYIYIYMYTHIWFLYTYIYVYIYGIYICVYIYIYIHTHTIVSYL